MAEKKTRTLFEDASTAAPEAVQPAGDVALVKAATRRRIQLWQACLALLVVVMVAVGGLTRLTDSGLSITEWNLITGILPPLSAEGWTSEFAKYQKIPEFQEVNYEMTLSEFKTIYWWEWGHRFLGRIVGLAFIIPFLWFLLRKAIPVGWTKRLLIPGVLIGVQGVIGWWMVSSGLTERVDVAPYRLATHLGIAFLIFALLVWNVLNFGHQEHELLAARRRRFKPLLGMAGLTTAAIFLQILAGAMVAGLDAGRGYTDWPLMQGSFFPPNDTPEAIWQFIHRMLGYFVVGLVAVFWWRCRSSAHRQVKFWSLVLLLGIASQMLWGIITLMNGAVWNQALLHQLGAVGVMFLMMRVMFEVAYPADQPIDRA